MVDSENRAAIYIDFDNIVISRYNQLHGANDSAVVAQTEQTEDPQVLATDLLVRAMRLVRAKSDSDWLFASSVKAQMRRLDPTFHEVGLGNSTFSDFIRSRDSIVELNEDSPYNARVLRLREG